MRFSITITHSGLNKIRRISGPDKWLIEEKAKAQKLAWDKQWTARVETNNRRTQREQQTLLREGKKLLASQRTADAEEAIKACATILANRKSDINIWKNLKGETKFPEPKPAPPNKPKIASKPNPDAIEFQPALGFLDRIFSSRRRKREAEAGERLRVAEQQWKEYEAAVFRYEQDVHAWEELLKEFLNAQERKNAAIDDLRRRYENGDPEAVAEYADTLLSLSEYPDWCPKEFDIAFTSENHVLVVDYRLPALADMPTLKLVKYIQIRDTFENVDFKLSDTNVRYDDVSYQICLRVLHEIFRHDTAVAIQVIVVNGWVHYIDPSHGKEVRSCIMSVQASRNEFQDIILNQIDPRACFRALKGVGSSKLHGMAAVPPLMRINRDDSRFIPAVPIVDSLDEGTNIAAIGWEDFEYLIREIFEKEFSRNGGEVKVTRASRDGGVDAVAFDPDPIRGGKIVIQAKRYTNTVGVSAVRDLYGTVMNEGATKGILVTTATFGPDAYAFAKDKPLTLMDGGALLYLLQQHGHKAYINLREAKLTNPAPLMRSVKESAAK